MLLAIDVGNTNMVFGLYDGDKLRGSFRISTNSERTSDELGMLIAQYYHFHDIACADTTAVVIASVVPPVMYTLINAIRKYLFVQPVIAGRDADIGIENCYANPREVGADIAVGDGQPLGLDTAFGGPYLGFMATTAAMTRKLPGRIVGQTKDVDGKTGYVLTLSAREQHIRREKASSNICSNQALCAFTAGVYMAAMGEAGMKQCARLCTSKAHYFAAELVKAGCKLKYQGEFFHEFVTEVECPNCRKKILDALDAADILGGAEVDGGILWCVTELVSKAQLDKAVSIVKEVLK